MVLTLLKYDNRKLYIPKNQNTVAMTDTFGVGYTTLACIRSFLGIYPKLILNVIHVRTRKDVTKDVLLSALRPDLFTLGDLHSLLREQAQGISVLNSLPSETKVCTNGAEL